jgi:hypothetical protein
MAHMFRLPFLMALCLLIFCASASAFRGFKNKSEAQMEMDKMYGTGEDTVTADDWRNNYTSIVKFMEAVTAHPKEKVFIIYSDDSQLDAVKMLCAFLCRKRGGQNVMAQPYQHCVYPVKSTKVRLENIRRYKAFLLGGPGTIPFLDRMAKKGKLSVTSTKAQFKLFARPNCLAIACTKSAMYLELVRVFLRSFPDFDDECYSYFYMN